MRWRRWLCGGTVAAGGTHRRRQPAWRWALPAVVSVLVLLPIGAALAQSQPRQRPAIGIAATIRAQPAARTPLSIAVGPEDALPRNGYLRIRGLPPTVALTEGHAIAPGVWAIPLSVLPMLAAVVPTGAEGATEIVLDLVSLDGKVLAESKATLIIGVPNSALPSPSGSAAMADPAAAPTNTPDHEQALRFYHRGQDVLERGDVDAARRFFERAADMGLPQGALALATTYDPNELAKLKVVGLKGNIAAARKWYDRAAELGATEASERLRRLNAR